MIEKSLGLFTDPTVLPAWRETEEASRDAGPRRRREFSDLYERASFIFRHDLCRWPELQLAGLRELASRRRGQEDLCYWSSGSVGVADGWAGGVRNRPPLVETVAGIADGDALVMLKHVERDPVLGPQFTSILSRVIDLAGERMRADVLVGRATILIASPRRITAYHVDADTNFLFQVSGHKTLWVHDRTGQRIVTEREEERFFAGDVDAAVFDPRRRAEANAYDLEEGTGVHIPSMCPHWAQNGDDVSIAVSLNFDLRSIQRNGRIRAINHRLRRLGANPRPPGVSPVVDGIKLAAAETGRALRQGKRLVGLAR